MSSDSNSERPDDEPFDGSFDATTRRQILLGLELDAAARLRWLEETMEQLARLRGMAQRPPR